MKKEQRKMDIKKKENIVITTKKKTEPIKSKVEMKYEYKFDNHSIYKKMEDAIILNKKPRHEVLEKLRENIPYQPIAVNRLSFSRRLNDPKRSVPQCN